MKKYSDELTESRFFREEDENRNFLMYPISQEWWSRGYEYIWASKFIEDDDVILDAACGVGHHLKYYLASKCKKVYACDVEPMICNKEFMLNVIKDGFGEEASRSIDNIYDKIDFKPYDIANLPYENEKFDKIFCISVLEHLTNSCMEDSIKGFYRTLKKGGIVILTFDYPLIDINLLEELVEECKFEFLGDIDYRISENVLESNIYPNLRCCRAVLVKK